MDKKAIVLATAEELPAAPSRQPLVSSAELEARRLRHRFASERFSEDAMNANLNPRRARVAVGLKA